MFSSIASNSDRFREIASSSFAARVRRAAADTFSLLILLALWAFDFSKAWFSAFWMLSFSSNSTFRLSISASLSLFTCAMCSWRELTCDFSSSKTFAEDFMTSVRGGS